MVDGKVVVIVVLVILLVAVVYKLSQKPEKVLVPVPKRCPPAKLPGMKHNIPSSDTATLKDVEDETQEEQFVWGPRRWFCPCGRWGRRRCPCRYRDYGYWM